MCIVFRLLKTQKNLIKDIKILENMDNIIDDNNIIMANDQDKINNKIDKLCLKIYIIGSGDKKEYIIKNHFKSEIVDPYLER